MAFCLQVIWPLQLGQCVCDRLVSGRVMFDGTVAYASKSKKGYSFLQYCVLVFIAVYVARLPLSVLAKKPV